MTPAQMAVRAGLVPGGVRDTGALQRQSPLPRGTYWIDVFGLDKIAIFANWLTENRGIVAVISSEEDLQGDNPSGWYLFKVTGGTTGQFLPVWDSVTFGYPTIATPDIHTKDDTVSKPSTEPGFFDGFLGDAISNNFGTVLLVGGAGLAYALYRFSKSRKEEE